MNTDKYMTLDELKVRLRITDDEHDDYLKVLLEDVIQHVLTWTNNRFPRGFPSDVKRAVAQLVALQKQIDDKVLLSSGSWGGGDENGVVEKEVKSVRIDGLQETYVTSSESAAGSVGGWEKFMQLENSPYEILRYYRIVRSRSSGRRCGYGSRF